MGFDQQSLEELLFQYLDKVKQMFSPETWENILLDCSKNELFVLLLLYRKKEVNMTQIAEYLAVPLNTATGIVARMEKKEIVARERSPQDKRVVTITMTQTGTGYIQKIMKEFLYYAQLILEHFTPEEIQLAIQMIDRTVTIVTQAQKEQKSITSKIRKIQID